MDTNIITEMDEQRIDELLTYTTGYSEQNAENIKKLFMQKTARKRSIGRRILLAAAIAAVTVVLSGIALAATGFDFDSIFNSIFSNKEASRYVQTGDGITALSNYGAMSVEPIAAFYESGLSGLYVKLRINDPTSSKALSDSLVFLENGMKIHTGQVFTEVIDSNNVFVSMFITPMPDIDRTIRFDTIASGITFYYEAQPTQFNIGEHLGLDRSVIVQGAEFIKVNGITLDGGTLEIGFCDSDASFYGWGSAFLGVMTLDGEAIWTNGVSVNAMTGEHFARIEIGSLNPDDLTLIWNGERADHTMTGSWEFAVSGDNVLEPRKYKGEFEGYEAQVTIGATSVGIEILADYLNNEFPYELTAIDGVTLMLTLSDGTIVYPKFSSSMNDSMMASFGYVMGFVNPADVVSVTFCGTTFPG